MFLLSFICCFQLLFQFIAAAKILIVVPMPSPSHLQLFEPIAVELGRRGHHVTYVSARAISPKEPNVTDVVVDTRMLTPDGRPTNFLEIRHFTLLDQIFTLPKSLEGVMHLLMASPEFQTMLKKEYHFDLILGEAFLSEGIMAGLMHRYKAPLIGLATFTPSYWTNYQVGCLAPTSYIPEPFTAITYHMTFFERLTNYAFSTLGHFNQWWYYFPMQERFLKQYFGDGLPSAIETIKNTSVLLVNDHYSTSYPRPAPPNMIGVAGLHVKPPKPLPKNFQDYLDESKNGAILFSLGSIIQGSLMPKEKIDIFVNAFSKLNVNVLWKFEKQLDNLPKNVFISKWLPQSDILAHPNLKLFITHGGLLSTTEAIERGVPLIGIPIFGDQPFNTKISVQEGVGLALDLDHVTEEGLLKTINEILHNPKYAKAAKVRSLRFRDNPQTPMERVIYWVEYVLRHDGAHHLRSAGQDLTWYELHQLDVIGVLLLIFYSVIKIIKVLLKIILKMFLKKNKID